MTRRPRLQPTDPRLFQLRIARSRRLSRSFQRVTLVGDDLHEFDYAGFDHWFRFFVPRASGAPFALPGVVGRSWWTSYLALDETSRPHCSNYTVADVRRTDDGVELDVDVVLHWDAAGELSAPVARWATTAEDGSPVAILDQGLIFDPSSDAGETILVCDETGLPAVRGILGGLPAEAQGVAIIEVPTADDVLSLAAPAGMRIDWVVRDDEHAVPGVAALAALQSVGSRSADDYAYIVGESNLATEGRRTLHRNGIPKSQITFSGYWKHSALAHAAR
jgi:NADPH-dependent ferric siderophore reductase